MEATWNVYHLNSGQQKNHPAAAAAAAAKSLQSCPTLCDPIDGSPPGSPVPGILQARTLEWVAIAFLKKIILVSSKFWLSKCVLITASMYEDVNGVQYELGKTEVTENDKTEPLKPLMVSNRERWGE